MINVDLFTKLWEVFPDSFSYSHKYKKTEWKAGPWGMEEIEAGEGTANLAENILNNANAIMIKYGLDRALKYIEEFKPAKVQAREIKNFTSV